MLSINNSYSARTGFICNIFLLYFKTAWEFVQDRPITVERDHKRTRGDLDSIFYHISQVSKLKTDYIRYNSRVDITQVLLCANKNSSLGNCNPDNFSQQL